MRRQNGQRCGELVLRVPLPFCPSHPSRAAAWPINFKSQGQQKLGIDKNPDSTSPSQSALPRGRGWLQMKRIPRPHCRVQSGCNEKLKRPTCLTDVLRSRPAHPRLRPLSLQTGEGFGIHGTSLLTGSQVEITLHSLPWWGASVPSASTCSFWFLLVPSIPPACRWMCGWEVRALCSWSRVGLLNTAHC